MSARRTAVALSVASAAVVAAGTTVVGVTADRTSAAGVVPSPSAAPAPTAGGPATVDVDGAPVPAIESRSVRDALAAAGITLRSGRYLAIMSQRPLGPDGRPGRVLVDGRPATPDTPLYGGERVTTRSGRDLVEPTETVRVRVPPPVASPLYVDGRDAVVRVVRGRLSHEEVSRRTLRRARVGHLVRPGAVALTFDDGPSAYTRRVLAVLRHHHVHATFCMIGRWAAAHPRTVRAVVAGGHALCDHTWDHDLELRRRPAAQIRLDIARGARAITRASRGVRPRFFRAPGGNWSPRVDAAAAALGLAQLRWTVDPRDWARPGVTSILRTVYREVRPGGIILLHDGGGDRRQTLRALPVLLHRLRRLGYHFVVPPAPTPAEVTAGTSTTA